MKPQQRRFGHHQTPVVVAMALMFCVGGIGVLRMIRDGKRAQSAHLSLDFADRAASFFRGSAWGALIFVGLIAALFGSLLISFWLENWRWKRFKTRK